MIFDKNIVLENEAVRLEPLSMEHYDHLLPIALNHPDLLLYSPSPFGSAEKLKDNIRLALEARTREERYAFAIYGKSEKRFVGSSSYGNLSVKDARVEIGWTWLDKETQGSGLNRHCKYLLLNYAFTELGMLRVEFKTDSRNLQSRRAIEKIGGIYEGSLRSHTVLPDGYRRDTVYYSILKDEWLKMRDGFLPDTH